MIGTSKHRRIIDCIRLKKKLKTNYSYFYGYELYSLYYRVVLHVCKKKNVVFRKNITVDFYKTRAFDLSVASYSSVSLYGSSSLLRRPCGSVVEIKSNWKWKYLTTTYTNGVLEFVRVSAERRGRTLRADRLLCEPHNESASCVLRRCDGIHVEKAICVAFRSVETS